MSERAVACVVVARVYNNNTQPEILGYGSASNLQVLIWISMIIPPILASRSKLRILQVPYKNLQVLYVCSEPIGLPYLLRYWFVLCLIRALLEHLPQ